MSDKDFAPLTAACVRGLNDKLYDKRKGAALEIERLVKDFVTTNQLDQITRTLKVLGGDFAYSQNPNTRKGGLIGLAAVAIGLGKESSTYINELVLPAVACFNDVDSRVQYYSCEALYNIVKVARGAVLPFFNEIFDGLSKLAAHPDQNVKNGAELLDRLIKDIVTESSSFDLVAFVPLLRERIYTKNTFARQFVVSWIEVLDAVPDINMIVLLPEILDGLFLILAEDSKEIRKMCQSVLAEFLEGIRRSKSDVNYTAMANILIVHSQNAHPLLQFTAISWLRHFVLLSGRTMLPHMAGMLSAVLPCLAYTDDTHYNVKVEAESLNKCLRNLVETQDDQPTPTADASQNSLLASAHDGPAQDSQTGTPGVVQLEMASVIKVLQQQLGHVDIHTRKAVLTWFNLLLVKTPNKTFRYVHVFFPLLMATLSDLSDDVVLLDLKVLSEISSNPVGLAAHLEEEGEGEEGEKGERSTPLSPWASSRHLGEMRPGLNQYFAHFMVELVTLFKQQRQLLEDRGSFIIRQLSVYLSAEATFSILSEIVLHEGDMEFARTMVQTLNTILLTSTELYDLRSQLKDLKTEFARTMVQTLNTILLTSTELYDLRSQLKDLKTEESCSLFCCLYRCWCHSPVATMSLCYLTQNYSHACLLLQSFADIEVTVDFLKEIDKLVQLIESPIFSYLRLQLLDTENNADLIKSLYGLLMILPQSEAFKLLRYRLDCIPTFNFNSSITVTNSKKRKGEERALVSKIPFQELLEHFLSVQVKHREAKRKIGVLNLTKHLRIT